MFGNGTWQRRLRDLSPKMIMANRARNNATWSMLDQAASSGFNFVIGIAAARALGVSEFGRFTLILMFATLAVTFVSYLAAAPMMTLAGQKGRRTSSYFAAVNLWGLLLSALGGLAVCLLLTVIFGTRDGTISLSMLLAAFAVTLAHGNHEIVRRTMFARYKGRKIFIADTIRFGFVGIVFAGLYFSSASVSAELVLLILAGSAAAVVLPINFTIFGAPLRFRLIAEVWLRHWPMSRWLVLMVAVSIGQEQIVWVIVGTTLDDAAVGSLRAGQYLLGITHLIMMALENIIPRHASEVYTAQGLQGLRAYLTRQTLLYGAATGALILGLVIPAKFWLGLLFGPQFVDLAPILWIYGLAYAVVFVREMWVFYFRTVESTRSVFNAYAVSSLSALVLAYPIIISYGILGAALVVLVAHVVSMIYIVTAAFRGVAAPMPSPSNI